jgi:hypothetical protein
MNIDIKETLTEFLGELENTCFGEKGVENLIKGLLGDNESLIIMYTGWLISRYGTTSADFIMDDSLTDIASDDITDVVDKWLQQRGIEV